MFSLLSIKINEKEISSSYSTSLVCLYHKCLDQHYHYWYSRIYLSCLGSIDPPALLFYHQLKNYRAIVLSQLFRRKIMDVSVSSELYQQIFVFSKIHLSSSFCYYQFRLCLYVLSITIARARDYSLMIIKSILFR